MPRIVVIRKSVRAFICGIIGFLPIMGVVPGLYAIFCWADIAIRYPNEWNPASAYLSWGARLATLGLLNSALLVSVLILQFG
jgi:hypothetical protein